MNLHLDLYPTSIEQCYELLDDAAIMLQRWYNLPELTRLHHQQTDSKHYNAYLIAKFVHQVVEQHQTGKPI